MIMSNHLFNQMLFLPRARRIALQALTLLAGFMLTAPALALELPKPSRADHRVRYATYNPANVIQLDAVIGVATLIVL